MNLCKMVRKFFAAALFVTLSQTTPAIAELSYETECCPSSWGKFNVYGKVLYWKAVQEQTAYAAILPGGIQPIIQAISNENEKTESIGLSTLLLDLAVADESGTLAIAEKLKISDPVFKYEPGFTIGLGYQTACGDWDFQLAWTRLHEKITSCVKDETGGVFPLTAPVGVIFGFVGEKETSQFSFATKAESRWKFQFDTLDFEIGKTFSFCNCVGLRPFLGIKAASILQKQTNEYIGFDVMGEPVSLAVEKTNNFRGVGPSLGFDASWDLSQLEPDKQLFPAPSYVENLTSKTTRLHCKPQSHRHHPQPLQKLPRKTHGGYGYWDRLEHVRVRRFLDAHRDFL